MAAKVAKQVYMYMQLGLFGSDLYTRLDLFGRAMHVVEADLEVQYPFAE